ncbi:MAG: hypothetical protein PVF29_03710 [Desulfobacterales bacterium]
MQTGIAQYGVVGVMDTGKPGKTLLIRSDEAVLLLGIETYCQVALDLLG